MPERFNTPAFTFANDGRDIPCGDKAPFTFFTAPRAVSAPIGAVDMQECARTFAARFSSDTEERCECCDDELTLVRVARCESGHAHCVACVHKLIESAVSRSWDQLKPEEQASCTFRVCCGSFGCAQPCAGSFLRTELASVLFPSDLKHYDAANQLLAETAYVLKGGGSADVLPALRHERYLQARYRQQAGSYAAFMCPHCGTGPIEHRACADLTAHHEEALSSGGRISNACPGCGWLAMSIREWRRWDGVVREPKAGAAMEVEERRAADADAEARCRSAILGACAAAAEAFAERPAWQSCNVAMRAGRGS
jgi:hypothetical protein